MVGWWEEGGRERESGACRRLAGPGRAPRPPLSPLSINLTLSPSTAHHPQINGKACTHEVEWPPLPQGQEEAPSPSTFRPLCPPPPRPGPPAKTYPFPLDPFQSTSVACLEAGHSVLVAAHTSAGKTVVAEYAIAAARRDGKRAIYTAPLKALSNQKYRELKAEFGDVGLLTGDVSIDPGAGTLVMTTEVLRALLYTGSEAAREAGVLIFDEVHYLRDKERGVVWEECIALAPRTAQLCFLSATLPNAAEFAAWVAAVHGRPCHCVYTDFRPTPLRQYVFPAGGAGLHLVVDGGSGFREAAFGRALAELVEDEDGDDGGKKKRARGGGGGAATGELALLAAAPGRGGGVVTASNGAGGKGGGGSSASQPPSDIYRLLRMLVARSLDPVIVFAFSKRECEALAASLAPLELNSEAEAAAVDAVYAAATDGLSPDDARLPQVTALLPSLRRGVGVHHAGLLPMLKEAVELLFGEGLLKCLVATETFSTGLNMPAKTVVFTGARKFDGGTFRWLSPGEYTQMAGRAGRRGLDAAGTVILCLDGRLDPAAARAMLRGSADPLASEFRLSYAGLLAMARAPDADPARLVAASFAAFQAGRAAPAESAAAAALEAAAGGVAVRDEGAVGAVASLRAARAEAAATARAHAMAPALVAPFLQPGRLVRLSSRGEQGGPPSSSAACWGAVVAFHRVRGGLAAGGVKGEVIDCVVDVLANWAPAAKGGPGPAGEGGGGPPSPSPPPPPQAALPAADPAGVPSVRALHLSSGGLDALASIRVYLPSNLRTLAARADGLRAIAEVGRRFEGEVAGAGAGAGIPLLDPVADLGVAAPAFAAAAARLATLDASLATHPLAADPDLPALEAALARKRALAGAAAAARAAATGGGAAAALTAELAARSRVLSRLGYTSGDGDGGGGSSSTSISLKGRVAAELASAGGAELALTEVAFGGGLAGVRPDALAALLSCVAWREPPPAGGGSGGGQAPPALPPPEVEAPLAALRSSARRIAGLEGEVGLEGALTPDDAAAGLRPDMAGAVLAWARGARFVDALKAADVPGAFEGGLVRVLRRVEELARQLAAGADAVGDAALGDLARAAGAKVRRGVAFAPSLYL